MLHNPSTANLDVEVHQKCQFCKLIIQCLTRWEIGSQFSQLSVDNGDAVIVVSVQWWRRRCCFCLYHHRRVIQLEVLTTFTPTDGILGLYSKIGLPTSNLIYSDCSVGLIKCTFIFCRSEFDVGQSMTNPNVIAHSETLLHEDLPSSLFCPNGIYHVFRKDWGSLGGGVCLMFKRSPVVNLRTVLIPDNF